jgi:hypothetical protein
MQGVETGPDEQVEQHQDQQLVEAVDEAVLRQAPQEQELEAAGKIAKQARAQAVPRRLRGGLMYRQVGRRVQ